MKRIIAVKEGELVTMLGQLWIAENKKFLYEEMSAPKRKSMYLKAFLGISGAVVQGITDDFGRGVASVKCKFVLN
jgi:hypothetical protein